MMTWESGDHVYHEKQDDDDFWRQPNFLFGHQASWRFYCTLCERA